MKKVLHPARLILCFLTFYFSIVLSSSGQNLSDSEPAAQILQGVDQGSVACAYYNNEVEFKKSILLNFRITNNDRMFFGCLGEDTSPNKKK